MLKRKTHSLNFKGLQEALQAPADFTQSFTERVAAIARLLGEELGGEVEHDEDMNYSAAQTIAIWLDPTGELLTPQMRSARFRLIGFVSSKGPFFTIRVFKLCKARLNGAEASWHWKIVAADGLPEKVQALQEKFADVLVSQGYSSLNEPILLHPVEGRLTEMDGRQATVRDILFGELI